MKNILPCLVMFVLSCDSEEETTNEFSEPEQTVPEVFENSDLEPEIKAESIMNAGELFYLMGEKENEVSKVFKNGIREGKDDKLRFLRGTFGFYEVVCFFTNVDSICVAINVSPPSYVLKKEAIDYIKGHFTAVSSTSWKTTHKGFIKYIECEQSGILKGKLQLIKK